MNKKLLEDIIYTLNSLPNRKVTGKNRTTYDLVKKIENYLGGQELDPWDLDTKYPVIVMWRDNKCEFEYTIEDIISDCEKGFTVLDKDTRQIYNYQKEKLWLSNLIY